MSLTALFNRSHFSCPTLARSPVISFLYSRLQAAAFRPPFCVSEGLDETSVTRKEQLRGQSHRPGQKGKKSAGGGGGGVGLG